MIRFIRMVRAGDATPDPSRPYAWPRTRHFAGWMPPRFDRKLAQVFALQFREVVLHPDIDACGCFHNYTLMGAKKHRILPRYSAWIVLGLGDIRLPTMGSGKISRVSEEYSSNQCHSPEDCIAGEES